MAWTYCIIGGIFCIAGLFLFKKRIFEENKSISSSMLIILMGVILLTIGLGKVYGVFS